MIIIIMIIIIISPRWFTLSREKFHGIMIMRNGREKKYEKDNDEKIRAVGGLMFKVYFVVFFNFVLTQQRISTYI